MDSGFNRTFHRIASLPPAEYGKSVSTGSLGPAGFEAGKRK